MMQPIICSFYLDYNGACPKNYSLGVYDYENILVRQYTQTYICVLYIL